MQLKRRERFADYPFGARLGDEEGAARQSRGILSRSCRADDDRCRRPACDDLVRQLTAVDAAWHVDVRVEKGGAVERLEEQKRVTGGAGLQHVEAEITEHVGGFQTD